MSTIWNILFTPSSIHSTSTTFKSSSIKWTFKVGLFWWSPSKLRRTIGCCWWVIECNHWWNCINVPSSNFSFYNISNIVSSCDFEIMSSMWNISTRPLSSHTFTASFKSPVVQRTLKLHSSCHIPFKHWWTVGNSWCLSKRQCNFCRCWKSHQVLKWVC